MLCVRQYQIFCQDLILSVKINKCTLPINTKICIHFLKMEIYIHINEEINILFSVYERLPGCAFVCHMHTVTVEEEESGETSGNEPTDVCEWPCGN